MNIFVPSAKLVVLKELPFSDYAFPRWQSNAAILLLGILSGVLQVLMPLRPGAPMFPSWYVIGSSILIMWVGYLVAVRVLRGWLKRGDRWDGEGDLFNLVAAAWFLIHTISFLLALSGAQPYIVTPLWIYSLWVAGNALSGAIPKASLGYSIVGILLGTLASVLLGALIGGVGGALLAILGLVQVPHGAAG